jgi:hypothetical protein
MLESSNMGPIGMARKGMDYIFVILILLKFLNYTLKCLAIIWTNIDTYVAKLNKKVNIP